MRDLIIDMADFGGVASAGDEVVLSAPEVRGSSVDPERIITPQPRALELVDGVVTVPVEVGPLRVTLKPQGGVLSGTTFKTVVPEGEGPITLRDCLENQFRYEPPVVSAVGELTARAELAATAAESSAGSAGGAEVRADGYAQSAGQSATLAGEHAAATGDDRRQTGLDRQHVDGVKAHVEDASSAAIAAAGIVDSKLDLAEVAATQMATFNIDFMEDQQDSGLFVVPSHGLTPDPDNPGLYLIGA